MEFLPLIIFIILLSIVFLLLLFFSFLLRSFNPAQGKGTRIHLEEASDFGELEELGKGDLRITSLVPAYFVFLNLILLLLVMSFAMYGLPPGGRQMGDFWQISVFFFLLFIGVYLFVLISRQTKLEK